MKFTLLLMSNNYLKTNVGVALLCYEDSKTLHVPIV